MEQSQIEIIDTVCQNLQAIASLIENYVSQKKIRDFNAFA
jgi:hypothetical protein